MQNQYYTPNIEDIYIGYECEIYSQTSNKLISDVKWHSVKVDYYHDETRTLNVNNIKKVIRKRHIRTPYLTKEKIEEEGWEITFNTIDEIYFQKGKYKMEYFQKDKELLIGEDLYYPNYNGSCPSINEFRYICKLLNI